MTDILDLEHVDIAPVSVNIRGTHLFARFDEWAANQPGQPDEVEVSCAWVGLGDLGVPLDQADDMVAKLRDWVNRLDLAVQQARNGGAR